MEVKRLVSHLEAYSRMIRNITTVIITVCIIQVLHGRSLTELRELDNTTNNILFNNVTLEETSQFINHILHESERLSDEFETAVQHFQKITSLISKLLHYTVVFDDNVTTTINLHPEM